MSQYTDFYMSWLGFSGGGVTSSRLRDTFPIIFSPTDISGCALWFDANNNTSVTYDDLLQVSSWSNLGTIPCQWETPNTGGVSYAQYLQNGLNTVGFASNAYMSTSMALDFQERSMFFVSRETSVPPGVANPWISSDTEDGMETFSLVNGTTIFFLGKHPSPIPELAAETNLNFLSTTNLVTLINATDASNNFAGINTLSLPSIYSAPASGYNTSSIVYYLGGFFNGSNVPSTQDICEIIVYDHALDPYQRETVETYLMRKWAITSPPPPAFTPLSLSNCGLWFDASQTTTISESSNVVSSWSNLGLNGGVASSNEGTITSGVTTLNSNNAVTFDAYSEMTFPWAKAAQDTTIFTVCRANTDMSSSGAVIYLLNPQDEGNYLTTVFFYNSSFSPTAPWVYTNIVTGSYFATTGVSTSNITSNVIQVTLVSGVDSNAADARLNGVALTLPPAYQGAANLLQMELTYRIGSVNENMNWDLGELIQYDRVLTESEILQVQNYLQLKWAI